MWQHVAHDAWLHKEQQDMLQWVAAAAAAAAAANCT
jgi:hypothetical protein